jgi:hypothetical protein
MGILYTVEEGKKLFAWIQEGMGILPRVMLLRPIAYNPAKQNFFK